MSESLSVSDPILAVIDGVVLPVISFSHEKENILGSNGSVVSVTIKLLNEYKVREVLRRYFKNDDAMYILMNNAKTVLAICDPFFPSTDSVRSNKPTFSVEMNTHELIKWETPKAYK